MHGASQVITRPTAADLRARLPQLVAGLLAVALGLALLVESDLGVDPWTVLHQGVAEHTPLTVGTATVVVGLAVFALWVPLRQRPGVATPVNVLGIGLALDAALAVLPHPDALGGRVAFLLAGTLLTGAGVGVYLGAHLGTGPRDGVMVALARGRSIRLVRTAMELGALVVGWLLGGTVGIGTLLMAVTIGPVSHAVLGRVDRPVVAAPPGLA